jgi:probable HAF family extracellular repeat protein
MHHALLSAVLSLSALLSPLVAAQDASYTFTTIEVPGATDTDPIGINGRQIVGQFVPEPPERLGFLTSDGITFTTIEVPGAEYTLAAGINGRGQIVGTFGDTAKRAHGFLTMPPALCPPLPTASTIAARSWGGSMILRRPVAF